MSHSLRRYVTFVNSQNGKTRIGDLHSHADLIQPLAFISGTPISNLYQVIEAGEDNIIAVESPIPASSTKLLPPIQGRDILAVGKNYADHAKELNKSGYDNSKKLDLPPGPVIFSKRATSIIASGDDIYPHHEFTSTADYEGEIGVIIGKPGFRIAEEDAWSHVWGYTIINDMTARERQRENLQLFFLGKSPDTYCPMGPVAIQAKHLPLPLTLKTHVNGELRQEGTTDQLIFSIPNIIKTISEGQTLQVGDVIATGTPSGVGIGMTPPVFLQPGDEITVSVSGIGTLSNRIATKQSLNATIDRLNTESHIRLTNFAPTLNGVGLTAINGKLVNYKQAGSGNPIVFMHGIGGTMEYWTPFIEAANLTEAHAVHTYDLEGHGLSPTSPLSKLSMASFKSDLEGVLQHAGLDKNVTLVAHSSSCWAALLFVISRPGVVSKLILMGPPPLPLPDEKRILRATWANTARERGMSAVVDEVANEEVSAKTKANNVIGLTAVRLSLMGQDPEGFAKGCATITEFTDAVDLAQVDAQVLIVTGDDDAVAPLGSCRKMAAGMGKCDVETVPECGHWHLFENVNGVCRAVRKFL